MALSVIVIPGDGVTTQFSIPFALGYIKENDITARVGDEQDATGNPIYRTLTFLSPTSVVVSGAPAPIGTNIVFSRTVEREKLLVDYEDGDIINEDNMNTAQRQAIMLVHEVLDGRFEQFQASPSFGGFRIRNVGDPIERTDAATKGYIDDRLSTGANNAAAAAASAAAAAASASTASSQASAASAARTASEAARDTSVAAANSATGSVTSAATAATAAENSASAALASQTAAGNSAAAAATARTGAETARNAAQVAQTASETARTGAQAAQTASAGSASAASGSATAAANSASGASTSATTATTKATEATTARDNAYKWSQEEEDTPVDDGTHTGYSAYHWSKKAELAAGGGVSSWAGLSGTVTVAQAQDIIRQFRASVAAQAALNIPQGVAPTTPVDGDVWTLTTGMWMRRNGVTVNFWDSANLLAGTAALANAGTDASNRIWSAANIRSGVAAYAQKRPTVSTAAPSGGVDGDVWFQV